MESSGSRENLLDPGETQRNCENVSFLQLFRFSSSFDRLLIIFGSVVAAVAGLSKPIMSGLLGKLSQAFINFTNEVAGLNHTDPRREEIYTDFHSAVTFYVLTYFLLFVATFITGFLQDLCFILAGENMVNRLRKTFMRAVMRQEIAWFDAKSTGSLTTELFSNIEKFKNGNGDHIGYSVHTLSMFVSGFAICFYCDWRLTAIGTCLTPFIALWGYWDNNKMTSLAVRQEEKDGEAGAVAEQALTSIRTVMMFNGQEQECSRYEKKLDKVRNTGILIGRYNGTWNGVSIFLLFASFWLTVWFGTNFYYEGQTTGGNVITIFICIQLCIGHLDRIAPIISKVNRAKGAAVALYEVIDRVPEIDAYSEEGSKMEVEGRIQLQGLRFSYPSRPDVPVLRGVDLTIIPGQTVALVGASGSGKSTIVQLLLRFYDPTEGRITIDGVDLDEFHISYLRQIIGVVSQEPMLFNTTIEENIRYGRENISEQEIWSALKKSNAYDFVKAFPKGLQTLVGDRGAQLSGGQKQRVAIARALVREPKILLLDEATSALDAQSETIVQQALENAAKGRTTLVIAHRLSTIRNADKIIAMKDGEIAEVGTHEELTNKKGLYFELVNNQVFVDSEETVSRPQYHFSRSVSSEGTMEHRRRRSISFQETIPEEKVMDDADVTRLKEELEKEGVLDTNIWRLFKETRPEWKILVLTVAVSMIEGAVYPMLSFGFTELVKIFSSKPDDTMLRHGHMFSFLFLYIGLHYGLTTFTGQSLFSLVAERLAHRLRMKVFRNIMRQDAGYFDKPLHAPGRLMTRLASDANNIKPAINERLGFVIAECTTDFLAISFSLYFGWQMTLMAVPIFPLAFVAWSFKNRFVARKILQDEKDMESIGKLATEAISNIRTVHALTLQEKVYENFCDLLKGPIRTGRQRAVLQSIAYGTTISLHYLIYGLCFRAGLYFIYHNYMTAPDMMRALFMVSFACGSLGAITEFYPDYIKARMAAALLFKMIDEKPRIDGMSKEGGRPMIEGNIKIKDLRFCYPEREDVEVLKGLDLEVKEGQIVALVGPSGCGKSTVASLLERLYDPQEGAIEIDGYNIAAMNPNHLRSNLSMVSQEPVLFDMTIKENILYGLQTQSISHMQLIESAKKANIHEFISYLPEGYSTRVKGTLLSGGQKQRIAIARALVREPKVLILDEATSALDTESEKHVQLALEHATAGRSCLVVAHRLSTIRNAHQILVFSEGRIEERGTHSELMEKKGVYFQLIQKQSSSK